MNTLDSIKMVDPKEVSPQPIILRYGLILGLVLVGLSLVANMAGLNDPSKSQYGGMLIGLVSMVLYIGFQISGIKKHRDADLGGFVSFGRAFTVAFGIGLIAALVSLVFNYLYMNLINPDFTNQIMESTREQYEKQGMSEEQIEMALGWVTWAFKPLGQLISFAVACGMGALVCLIIAAIMKKQPAVA